MIPMHSLSTFQVPLTTNSRARPSFASGRKSLGLVDRRRVRMCVASVLKQLRWLLPRKPSPPSTTTSRKTRCRKTIPWYITGSRQKSSHRRSLVLSGNFTLARTSRRRHVQMSPLYVHFDFGVVTLSPIPQLDGRQ